MYNIRKNLALLSITIAVLSTVFCPFLKVFLAGSWNLYKVDTYLFFITNGILGLMFLFVLLDKARLFRFLSFTFMAWCVIALVAVYFKSSNYFGMKFADGLIAKSLSLQWGWIVLFSSALFLLVSVHKSKA